MSKKTDSFYFENFKEIAKICVQASEYLVNCLKNYDINKIQEWLAEMHEFEHLADDKKHEMSKVLSKAFITPIEREDLAEMSSKLDEIVDTIEEVLQCFYVDEPKNVTNEAILFAEKINVIVVAVCEMLDEFENFKKSNKLDEAVVKISTLEEDCDRLYLDAYRNIKKQTSDLSEVIAWRKIYDYFENCADACEHVADTIDLILLKNT